MQTVTLNLDHLEKDPNPTYYTQRISNFKQLRAAQGVATISRSPSPTTTSEPRQAQHHVQESHSGITPLRVVFLDVDGVLNTADQRLATSIHPTCLRNFCNMVVRTDSYICISSTWRKHKAFMNKLVSSLAIHGVEDRVIGKTIQIAPFERPAEIMNWIQGLESNYELRVDAWVAVDDMPLEQMSRDMRGKCILTNIIDGFLLPMVGAGEEILRRQIESSRKVVSGGRKEGHYVNA